MESVAVLLTASVMVELRIGDWGLQRPAVATWREPERARAARATNERMVRLQQVMNKND